MSKPQTNVEFVTDLMEDSEVGTMAQIIVIQGIHSYTSKVVEQGLEEVKRQFGPNSFIDPVSWFRGCEEIQRKLDQRSAT